MYVLIKNGFENYLKNFRAIPPICLSLIALQFIQAITIGVCYFLSLYFVNTLKFNVFNVGIFLSAYGVGTILGGIVGGKLSDLFSPIKISIASIILQACAFFSLIFAKEFYLLIFNLLILGFSAYGFKTSNDLLILNYCNNFEELKIKVINVGRVALNLGLGVSGVMVGLGGIGVFRYLFHFFCFLLAISALYLISQKNYLASKNQSTENSQQVASISKFDFKTIILILACLFCVGMLIAQLSSTYPIFVQNAFPELGTKSISTLYLLDTILIVLFQVSLINLVKKFNKILIVGFGAFLMGIGMLVLNYSEAFWLAIISCCIWTTGEMLFMPMAQLLCYDNSGERKGQIMGLFQSTYAASSIIGPIVGSYLYQFYSSQMLWIMCAVLGLACLLICLFFNNFFISTSSNADASS